MFVEAVFKFYSCGHGSDCNTWIELLWLVSEYLWQHSVYENSILALKNKHMPYEKLLFEWMKSNIATCLQLNLYARVPAFVSSLFFGFSLLSGLRCCQSYSAATTAIVRSQQCINTLVTHPWSRAQEIWMGEILIVELLSKNGKGFSWGILAPDLIFSTLFLCLMVDLFYESMMFSEK